MIIREKVLLSDIVDEISDDVIETLMNLPKGSELLDLSQKDFPALGIQNVQMTIKLSENRTIKISLDRELKGENDVKNSKPPVSEL